MIGLMDCNNFFVSCERLFRPDLVKRPVAVLSSNDGCVVARSQEVKDLGVKMGEPYFQLKDLCKKHDVTIFSSNFPLYRDISVRVMKALTEEFSKCEVYSVDEAFFEVPQNMSEGEIADIRHRIIQKTGIPVSFGIGATKTIAKMASTYAKRGTGVYVMDMQAWNTAIPDILCRNIWGIGRQTTKMLTDLGISSVKELLAQDYSFFKNTFGVIGGRLYLELSGLPAYRVGESETDEHTSLSSTRSFKDIVHKRSVLESALGYHIAHVCEKLREHNWAATHLTILAAPSRFGDYAYQKNSVSVKLTEPTNETSALLKVALKCLDSIYDMRVPYKKAGVVVSGIVPERFISNSLFSDGESNRKKLDEITDTLNHRFGNGSVRSGVVLMTEKWKVSQKLKSREYTTQWKDIPSVKAI